MPIKSASDEAPLTGIPSLMGILEKNNIDCRNINLNSEYLMYLTEEKVKHSYKKLKKFYKNKEYLNYPECFQEALINHKNFYIKNAIYISKNIKHLKYLKKLFKMQKIKNNPILYSYFISYENYIMKNISILFNQADNLYKKLNIKDLLYIFNCPLNNLKEFYEEKAKDIVNENPDIIGIQILRPEDILSGLLLGYLIKQNAKNIHINIGGNYFEEYYNKVTNLKDLFGIFFDSISIGDCTKNVVEITKYINKEIPIEQVSNLIYVKNNELEFGPKHTLKNINQLPFQSFSGYRREDYSLPELIFPMQASAGNSCYWGKCIYCNCSGHKKHYSLMSAKRFTDEIEYLYNKYNARYFAFWDNSMHPKYLEKIADILLEKNIKIKYNLYARLEEEFTKELLIKLKKSGCVMIYWGLDSGSEKILKYINKGINLSVAEKILKYSKDAGIYNFVYLLLGQPTETISDMKETLKFIEKNSKNIHYIESIKEILFFKEAIINKEYKYYKNLINNSEEFNSSKEEIIKQIDSKIKKSGQSIRFQFLYLAKYGWFRFSIMTKILNYYFNNKKTFLKKVLNLYFKFVILGNLKMKCYK